MMRIRCRSSAKADTEPSPVRGPATTSLTIPDRLVRGGSAPLRFFCDPIGSGGLPVSEEIVVEPGDVVELVIPSS